MLIWRWCWIRCGFLRFWLLGWWLLVSCVTWLSIVFTRSVCGLGFLVGDYRIVVMWLAVDLGFGFRYLLRVGLFLLVWVYFDG